MFSPDELITATAGRLLCRGKDSPVRGISIDSRTISPHQAFIAIRGDNFDGHDFIPAAIKQGASYIICQEAAAAPQQAKGVGVIKVKDTRAALGALAQFHRNRFNIPIIAVTGSNGKTTTKEMVARVLSSRYRVHRNEGTKNNQIGLALSLLGLRPVHELAVFEIGTNHFGEVDSLAKICRPTVCIITNIGPAHLLYFGTLKGVFQEKSALIRNLRSPYIAILNADDRYLRKILKSKAKGLFSLGFGISQSADFSASLINLSGGYLSFWVNRKEKVTLKTQGRHNIYNALAASAAGRLFGIPYPQICQRLGTFDFPKSRFNFITAKSLRFIDDTYNANPLSLEQALNTFTALKIKGRKIFVMGDMLELGRGEHLFHRRAGKHVARGCDAFIAVGKLSGQAANSAKEHGLADDAVFHCESVSEARRLLLQKIHPTTDDLILVKGSRLMKMEKVFGV